MTHETIESWLEWWNSHLDDDGWVRHFPGKAAEYRDRVDYWTSEIKRRRG